MNIGDFYHFRVHTDELDVDEMVEFLKEQTDIQFIVKEYGKGNREHIHSCFAFKTAKQTFIDRLKKRFPVIKGNKYYGCEKLKKGYDRNAQYCYKGTASDWPDILYTIHTSEQWKSYYNAYWKEFAELHKPKEVNMGCQNDSSLVVKVKSKSKTFMQRISEEFKEEHYKIIWSIWVFKGYKTSDPDIVTINSLEWCQDYVGNFLHRKLGSSVKNIDDMIFQRMYRGLYSYILSLCPDDLLMPITVNMLSKFRHNL